MYFSSRLACISQVDNTTPERVAQHHRGDAFMPPVQSTHSSVVYNLKFCVFASVANTRCIHPIKFCMSFWCTLIDIELLVPLQRTDYMILPIRASITGNLLEDSEVFSTSVSEKRLFFHAASAHLFILSPSFSLFCWTQSACAYPPAISAKRFNITTHKN